MSNQEQSVAPAGNLSRLLADIARPQAIGPAVPPAAAGIHIPRAASAAPLSVQPARSLVNGKSDFPLRSAVGDGLSRSPTRSEQPSSRGNSPSRPNDDEGMSLNTKIRLKEKQVFPFPRVHSSVITCTCLFSARLCAVSPEKLGVDCGS